MPLSKRTALLQLHGAAVFFGLSGIFGRMVTGSPELIVFGRSAFAVAALTFLCLHRDEPPWRNLKLSQALFLALIGILLALHWWTFFKAIKVGGVAVATLGFASFPAFVALFEALCFRERLSRVEMTLMALVSLGLVLVTPNFDFGDRGTEGLLWGVLSGGVYALNAIANRCSAAKISGMQASWWQYGCAALVGFPFAASQLPGTSAMDWLWVACLGLLCTAMAYTLFINSLHVLKARMAAIIIALEPVYAIAVAWMLFGEAPSLRMLAGGALILGAVIWSGLCKS